MILSYRGMTAEIHYDAEDGILVGRLVCIRDIVGFHADDASGLDRAFRDTVDDYIETLAKLGRATVG
jgi:predicted HicB family RNase H-like nuclease